MIWVKKHSIAVFFLCASLSAFSQHFKSGFEGSTMVVDNSWGNSVYPDLYDDLQGSQSSLYPSDWDIDLEYVTALGDFEYMVIYYDGGINSQRLASIVSDPAPDPGNYGDKALKFSITQAYQQGYKIDANSIGKVALRYKNVNTETEILGTGFEEFHFGVKIYIPPSYDNLKDFGNINYQNTWFTLMEFFNDDGTDLNVRKFRIHLNLIKLEGSQELNFRVKAQELASDGWTNDRWEVTGDYDVPTGEWLDLDIYYKEGDSITGKFELKVNDTDLDISVNNWTTHQNDDEPNGMTFFNPLKLYTGGQEIEDYQLKGVDVEVYWDDFIIYDDAKTKLRPKFLNLIDEDCPKTATTSDPIISVPEVFPDGGGGTGWSYLYKFSSPGLTTKYQGTAYKDLNLTPLIGSKLVDGVTYDVSVRVKNHPYYYNYWDPLYEPCEIALNFTAPAPMAANDQPNDDDLSLYPNPTFDVLNLEGKDFEAARFNVYSYGKHKLMGGQLDSSLQIDVSSLPKGFYLLELITSNQVVTKKFIKQ